MKKLIKTGNRALTEASPCYSIWGIGIDENEALMNLENWGENKLCNEHEYCMGSQNRRGGWHASRHERAKKDDIISSDSDLMNQTEEMDHKLVMDA